MKDRIVIFLFHRDLRLYDNTALMHAIRDSKSALILPLFIFPPEQIDPLKNKYFSNPAVQFMCESLTELDANLRELGSKLLMVQGDTLQVLHQLHNAMSYDAIYSNRDQTIYAMERDKSIQDWCKLHYVEYKDFEDYGLVKQNDCLLPDGRPYHVLAQYYKRILKDDPVQPINTYVLKNTKFVATKNMPKLNHTLDPSELNGKFYKENNDMKTKGGRSHGLKVLKNLHSHKKYNNERDFPALEGTTRASAHLRFGTISVREMYWELRKLMGADNGLIRELVFRDFYMKIYTHHPKLQRDVAFREVMDHNIPWKSPSKSLKEWKAWITGTTGFPLVDAGMRQLITEGWMHNRVRMLVASVATRYMYLDWRACAKYFYTRLVDADPFSNNAGWQWAAGIGVDSAPYFRAPFNPFLQSKRFDKDAVYIKRWVPELMDVKPEHIHRWNEAKIRGIYKDTVTTYPEPIVDQRERSKESMDIWTKAAKQK